MISTIEPSEIRETEAAMPVLMRFEKDYLEKHAPGKHNQQSHAGGRSGGKTNYSNLMDFVNEVYPLNSSDARKKQEEYLTQTYSQEINSSYKEYFDNYVGIEGLRVNRALREGEPQGLTDKKMIIGIEDAMKNTPNIDKPITVYRGIKNNPEAMTTFRQIKVGDVYEDRGFTSTSLDVGVAAYMAGSANSLKSQGIVLKINVPAGSEGVYPNSFLKGSNPFGQEVEFLLPRNSRFKVQAQLGKVWEVEVVNG